MWHMVLLNRCAPGAAKNVRFQIQPMVRVLFHYTEALRRHPIARHYRNYLFFQLVDKMRFPLSEFFFFFFFLSSPNLTGTISLGFWQGVN